MRLFVACAALLGVGFCGAVAVAAEYPPAWNWAFPISDTSAHFDTVVKRSIPGSALHFTEAETHDLLRAVDWRPGDHPPMPDGVATGQGAAFACGVCHLPTGLGRPENSALAGLSADYIERQVKALADGTRHATSLDYRPSRTMESIAKSVGADVVSGAARYFSALPFISHVRVIETDAIPHPAARGWVYVLASDGAKEPLGERIIETPTSYENFELRDPRMTYTAYVPRGAVAMGAALAKTGGPAAQPCAACHGAGLRGGIAPPLAGRSPTMLARQLFAFRAGTRANDEAAPMRVIAEQLDDRQTIALVAYAATLKP